MRSLLVLLAVLAIGAASAFASVYLAVARDWQPSAVHVGPWVIQSRTGQRDADPYARAAIARAGLVPLGTGEGALFIAREDSSGRPLSGACDYVMAGPLPSARAWTLAATDRSGHAPDNPSGRRALTSAEVLRDSNGRFAVALAADPLAGNWLPVPRAGRFTLWLRFYDAPIAATAGSLKPGDLPAIERTACR